MKSLFLFSRWFRGDEQIDGQTSNRFEVSEITRDYHGQQIQCQASNSVGDTKQSFTVLMKCKQTLTDFPFETLGGSLFLLFLWNTPKWPNFHFLFQSLQNSIIED